MNRNELLNLVSNAKPEEIPKIFLVLGVDSAKVLRGLYLETSEIRHNLEWLSETENPMFTKEVRGSYESLFMNTLEDNEKMIEIISRHCPRPKFSPPITLAKFRQLKREVINGEARR